MPRFREGVVTKLLSQRRGLQRVEVNGEPAYVLTQLVGDVAVGDNVVINTTAVDLGLGTGGWHVVHWNLGRHDLHTDGGGNVMKLRYTSLQADTGVAEEDGDLPESLDGTPVVAIGLHSQLACVAAAVKATDESLRVVYVMTDAGALPLALSDLLADLVYAGIVDATVTVGHAFGGDLEAVNIRSGLLVARHRLHADVIVAGMGPGSVGTGTTAGFSGLEVAGILDAAGDAGGQPIAALRVSDADHRPRHQGVSEHSRVALAAAHVAFVAPEPHDDLPDALGLLRRRGITPTTMGRTPDEDPRAFAFATAAGSYAATVAR
jgi:hypothetical protein